MNPRQRLDIALEARGLAPSRARARDAVLRGTVSVNGTVVTKPAAPVSDADTITLSDPAAGYVSRAALKLKAGLKATGWHVAGKICLDIGASTGGFTQVLAEAGAAKVYAVDVGHGQLHPDIAALPQVISREGLNARDLTAAIIPEPIDFLVCDASFVSITKIIAAPSALAAAGAHAILLVKPQFEVGREHIGKGGIVVPGPHLDAAIARVIATMAELGWRHALTLPSPIEGGDGNSETIAAFIRA